MATVHEVFSNYLRTNNELIDTFGKDKYNKAKVFYLENKKYIQPYATIWMIDDPKIRTVLCDSDGGTARFQCDTFTKTYIKGIKYREIFEQAVRDYHCGDLVNGVNIQWIEVINESDRSDTIDGLFNFSFEAVIHWKK